jgi:hypothetical protein
MKKDRHTSPGAQSWSPVQPIEVLAIHAVHVAQVRMQRPVEPLLHVPHAPPGLSQPKGIVVVVGELIVVVVVEVVIGQLGPLPGAGHASQQLVQLPIVPCLAAQCAASLLILHFVPAVVVKQQVTAPAGFPQIEWDAHFLTNPAQLWFTSTVVACCAAQLT